MPCCKHKTCIFQIVIYSPDQLFCRRKIFCNVTVQCFFNRHFSNICVDLFFGCLVQTLRAHAIDNRIRNKQRGVSIAPTAVAVIFCTASENSTTPAACFFLCHFIGCCIDLSVLQIMCTCFLIVADNCGINNRHIVL